jgi:hypothetical protein
MAIPFPSALVGGFGGGGEDQGGFGSMNPNPINPGPGITMPSGGVPGSTGLSPATVFAPWRRQYGKAYGGMRGSQQPTGTAALFPNLSSGVAAANPWMNAAMSPGMQAFGTPFGKPAGPGGFGDPNLPGTPKPPGGGGTRPPDIPPPGGGGGGGWPPPGGGGGDAGLVRPPGMSDADWEMYRRFMTQAPAPYSGLTDEAVKRMIQAGMFDPNGSRSMISALEGQARGDANALRMRSNTMQDLAGMDPSQAASMRLQRDMGTESEIQRMMTNARLQSMTQNRELLSGVLGKVLGWNYSPTKP